MTGSENSNNLLSAVEDGDIGRVNSLLAEGADPDHEIYWSQEWKDNFWQQYKSPPLHTACENGDLEMVKTLVQARASTEKGDVRYNRTPLHHACWGGHIDVVMYLTKEAGCLVDVRDVDHMTPAHHACWRGHKEVIKFLVEELHCDVDVRDGKGQSLLDRAFENVYYAEGCIDVTLYLTAYGCGSEEHKAKLLCEVSRRGRLDMAKELVEQHNVVPNGPCVSHYGGKTALELASEWGHNDILDYLKLQCEREQLREEPETTEASQQEQDTSQMRVEEQETVVESGSPQQLSLKGTSTVYQLLCSCYVKRLNVLLYYCLIEEPIV